MEKEKLNKRLIIMSAFFVPLAVPFFLLFMGLMTAKEIEFEEIGHFILIAIFGLIYGFFIWMPTMFGCMIIEYLAIKKDSSIIIVGIVFIAEAIIAFFALLFVFDFGRHIEMTVPLALAIIVTQSWRWLYLNRKDRIHNLDEPILGEPVDKNIN